MRNLIVFGLLFVALLGALAPAYWWHVGSLEHAAVLIGIDWPVIVVLALVSGAAAMAIPTSRSAAVVK